MTNAVFMPYVLAVNRDAIEARIARLAAYCGLPPSFEGFLHAITGAAREARGAAHAAPTSRSTASKRDLIAEMAIVDPTAGGNPVKLTKARGAGDLRPGDGGAAVGPPPSPPAVLPRRGRAGTAAAERVPQPPLRGAPARPAGWHSLGWDTSQPSSELGPGFRRDDGRWG